jgi:hypothetical protein
MVLKSNYGLYPRDSRRNILPFALVQLIREAVQRRSVYELAHDLMTQGVPLEYLAGLRCDFPNADGKVPDFLHADVLAQHCKRLSRPLKKEASRMFQDWIEAYDYQPGTWAGQTPQGPAPPLSMLNTGKEG